MASFEPRVFAMALVVQLWSWSAALALILFDLFVLQWPTLHLIGRTFKRDLANFRRTGKFFAYLSKQTRNDETVANLFTQTVKRHPDKIMFYYEDQKWTFAQADEYTNRVANYFASKGLQAGDKISIMMHNRPEMIFLWLGLAKIGVASALINTNLRKGPLEHTILTVNSKLVIFTPELAPSVLDVASNLRKNNPAITFFCLGQSEILSQFPAEDIEVALPTADNSAPKYRGHNSDHLLYIFTSGSTGLPKAAIVKNNRYIYGAAVSRLLAGVKDDDVLYAYLPFYHTAGGVVGISQSIVFGCTSAIAPKFSASKFWSDCIKYKCTVSQYIGEICRYLMMQPEKPEDRAHSVRLLIGNGLRPQMWRAFIERFGIDDIKELYGSTEGTGNMINMDKSVGNVGSIPTICRLSPFICSRIWKRYLIKVDEDTGVPLRGADGLCVQCGPNEPGEWVAVIDNSKPQTAFDGYVDRKSTSKKIYEDVISKGDRCFATGDILVYDDDGYVSFKDRRGDTFRWKGENVSTAEVEGIICKYAVEHDCVVFGVELPGNEGKAGMVALLDTDGKFEDPAELNKLLVKIRTELPTYAVPVIVRLTRQLEATGTFKLKKTSLVREGFDFSKVKDPMYVLDPASKAYVRLDNDWYDKLTKGQLRL